MNQEPVSLVLIGAGEIGGRHLKLVVGEPGCRLVAIADPAPQAEAVAREAGCSYYERYEEMLDGEQPEGAIVAAPTPLHEPIGIACAKRGIHMLMEKPVTDTVEAGHNLIKAAGDARVQIAVGHHRRFDPAVQAARAIIASGEIGRLVGVSGIWATRKHNDYYEADWRRQPGGGPVLINLIHDIDMLRFCCGEIESVYAETRNAERGLQVEDSGAVMLRFRSGAIATITFSDATPSPWGWERASGDNPRTPGIPENCFRFFGAEASFEFPNIAIWRNPPPAEPSWLQPIEKATRPLPQRAALAKQLKHFCQVVRGEVEPRVSAVDGLATLAATAALLESARQKQPVQPAFSLDG
jgi:predicted dehydrogenase